MLTEILKTSLPILVSMSFAYLIASLFVRQNRDKEKLKIKSKQADTSLRLQLQAMERLVLYMERIHPMNITNEVYRTGMNIRQFQMELIQQINKEFFHNLTQQLYIDAKDWESIRDAKEETLAMINGSIKELDPSLNAKVLIHEVAATVASHDGMLPSEEAILNLQASAQKLLNP